MLVIPKPEELCLDNYKIPYDMLHQLITLKLSDRRANSAFNPIDVFFNLMRLSSTEHSRKKDVYLRAKSVNILHHILSAARQYVMSTPIFFEAFDVEYKNFESCVVRTRGDHSRG